MVARFEQPVRAANVVRELGRQSVWPGPVTAGGLVVDDGSGPVEAVEERVVPPDVVLRPTGPLTEHVVTGQAPIAAEPSPVGPFDERVLNPIGFLADVDGPVVDARLARQRRAHREPRAIAASVARCPRRRP